MNWIILGIVGLILITAVALYEKVQKCLPRCPRCGSRYLYIRADCDWRCKECDWDGPEEDLHKR